MKSILVLLLIFAAATAGWFARERFGFMRLNVAATDGARKVLYAPYRTNDLPARAENLYFQIATAADPAPLVRCGLPRNLRNPQVGWSLLRHR